MSVMSLFDVVSRGFLVKVVGLVLHSPSVLAHGLCLFVMLESHVIGLEWIVDLTMLLQYWIGKRQGLGVRQFVCLQSV